MKVDANKIMVEKGPAALRSITDAARLFNCRNVHGEGQADDDSNEPPTVYPKNSAGGIAHDGLPAPSPPRFRLEPFGRIKWTTTEEYLVKGILPLEGLVLVYGEPKCGKSFWAFDLAMHVARGVDYRGKRVRQGEVVYLAAEGGAGFRKRVEAFRQRHDCTDARFHLCTVRPDLAADALTLIADIRAQLGSALPSAIFVDTLNRTLVGSENLPDDMARYLRAAATLQDEFGCCVVLIHHCGVEASRPRGHTSLTAAADVQIAVKRDAGEAIVVSIELAKDGPSGEQFVNRLDQVEIGVDEDGEKVTSCVILPSDGITIVKKPVSAPKLTPNQKTMFGILHDAGKLGMTREQWNDAGREAGIGVRRRADLTDIQGALKTKRLVRLYGNRWTVNHDSNRCSE